MLAFLLSASLTMAGGVAYYQVVASKPDDVRLLVNRLAIAYWFVASILIGLAAYVIERVSLDLSLAICVTLGTTVASIIASHFVIDYFRRRRLQAGGQRILKQLQGRLARFEGSQDG